MEGGRLLAKTREYTYGPDGERAGMKYENKDALNPYRYTDKRWNPVSDAGEAIKDSADEALEVGKFVAKARGARRTGPPARCRTVRRSAGPTAPGVR